MSFLSAETDQGRALPDSCKCLAPPRPADEMKPHADEPVDIEILADTANSSRRWKALLTGRSGKSRFLGSARNNALIHSPNLRWRHRTPVRNKLGFLSLAAEECRNVEIV